MQQDDTVTATPPPALKRTVTLTMLVLYGLGVTVGAGIYVLVGAAAARAGAHTPIAFVLAGLVMALSAASFAELATRFPISAGEAAYVRAGFGSKHLSLVTGLLVIAAGIVCAAAISRGAAGYIGVFVPLDETVIAAVVVVVIATIAAFGIGEAVTLAGLMTLIELAGLAAIVAAGLWSNPAMFARAGEMWTGLDDARAWTGIFHAATLAFFAFIGFEGMVNIAEEVEAPERTLPRAILLTLVISIALYILVVWVAIHAVPQAELAASSAPLSLVFARVTGMSPIVLTVIAIFATVNGIIAQLIMASRVVYGLAAQGSVPAVLGRIDRRTRTPLLATALVASAALVLVVSFPVERLAELTTHVMLVIFALVDAALIRIKLRGDGPTPPVSVPLAVPALGALSCVALLIAGLIAR